MIAKAAGPASKNGPSTVIDREIDHRVGGACSTTTSLVTFGPATDAETSETTSARAAIDAADANRRIFPHMDPSPSSMTENILVRRWPRRNLRPRVLLPTEVGSGGTAMRIYRVQVTR